MRSFFRQARAFAEVRVKLFFREPEAVFWVLVFPLVLALALGFAFKSRGPSPESAAVYSGDDPAKAAAIVSAIGESELITIEQQDDLEEAKDMLRRGKVGLLILPGEQTTFRFDPQRPESEISRLRLESALANAGSELESNGADASFYSSSTGPVVYEEVRETGSRYIDWLIPGLLGMNLMGTGVWGTGFAIADMRQKKLIRRFLVTPMNKGSFLSGFIASRLVSLFFELLVIVLFAVVVLSVPLRANKLEFLFVCVLGAMTFSAIGMLVVSRARTIEGLAGLTNLVLLPMWLLSGVFFSYERFPEALHPIIRALPLTALIDALRGMMLDGATLISLSREIVTITLWLIIGALVGIKIFRWE